MCALECTRADCADCTQDRPTCRMRVPIVICPKAVPFMRYDSRHLTTTLVEDMDSSAPTKMPCKEEQHTQVYAQQQGSKHRPQQQCKQLPSPVVMYLLLTANQSKGQSSLCIRTTGLCPTCVVTNQPGKSRHAGQQLHVQAWLPRA